jgi:hypothetical protein
MAGWTLGRYAIIVVIMQGITTSQGLLTKSVMNDCGKTSYSQYNTYMTLLDEAAFINFY